MREAIKITVILSVILSAFLASSARAEWVRILPGPVERVVANEGYAAALRNGDIWLLRDDGTVAGRIVLPTGETANPDPRAPRREADEILDRLDVADSDREEDWAVDLVYDERTLTQRRRARPRPRSLSALPASPPSLAAGGGNIWIASEDRLIRIGPDGHAIRERGPGDLRGEILAIGPWLATARPDGLHLLSTEGSAGNEKRVLQVPAQAGKVALSASGRRWAFSTAAGIAWTSDNSHHGSFTPASPVVDLLYCEEELVVLLADSLLVVSPHDEAPSVRSRDITARRILCPEGSGSPWLAAGPALLASIDHGRHWQTVDTPVGTEILAVAASAHHLWLAAKQGLYVSSDGLASPASPDATEQPKAMPRRRSRSHRSWLSWLPKVSLQASTVFAPDSHQLEAFAYATIPIDPRRLPVLAVAVDEAAATNSTTAGALPPERVLDLGDPDRDCLPLARRKAVELAMSEPERAASFVARAGRAAWLPELRLLVARRYGRSESLDIASSSTALSSPLGIDTVNDIRYEARATWDLARLVFSTEELAAQNQALHMTERRRDIESTVNRLYFERRRLAIEPARQDGGARRVRAGEIEAELDALSAGAFGACATGKSPR